MNVIKVTIKGVAGAGKTSLAHNIARMLEADGVAAVITDEGKLQSDRHGPSKFGLPTTVYIKVKEGS